MSMKSVLSFLLAFWCSSLLHAQRSQFQSEFTFRGGKYKITYYSDSIIKLTYYPVLYTTNENPSDAVIRGKASAFNALPLRVSSDSVFIDGRLYISGVHHSNEFRGFRFHLSEREMIFGGGERALPLNRRGYRLNLYNNPWYGYGEGADNLNYSVPFFTSSEGYGLFFDNASKAYADIGSSNKNVLEYGAVSGELNVYIMLGNYKQVLRSYHLLTGTQPLPPMWAFGNLMSRFGYTSERQVKDILDKMDKERMPVDAVIYDLFWFGDSIKGTLGNLEWVNKYNWPQPRKMIKDLKKDGIQTILVTEPFFVETSKNYASSKPYLAVDSNHKPYLLTDFYFGRGGLIDIFRKDAQQWFWQFYKKQMNNGVESWWGDLGEPEKHPTDLYHDLRDQGFKRLFSSDEVHNIYGHTWTKMLYRFYAKEYPQKRLFSLNRSGFAGSQRYSIFPWTGDVSRSWSGFRAQLPILLGMSMSGIPYVHSDAGGFAGGEGDLELYLRWLQFAVFTPVFRPHGTALYDIEPAAFSFPSEAALIDTPYRSMAAKAIHLRYALLPYNYSLAYQQFKWGKPLMAPFYYHFPDDTIAVKINDQFMWGEDIMVAPILEKNASIKTYYLPKGSWYRAIAPQEKLSGGKWYTDNTTLDDIPVFYKEGSFIIMNPSVEENTSHYTADSLAIWYMPSAQSSADELYNDDGNQKDAIEEKRYELISFRSSGLSSRKLEISIQGNGGSFPGKKMNKFFYFSIPLKDGKPSHLVVNNTVYREASGMQEDVKKAWLYKDGILHFGIEFRDKPVAISISW